MKPGLRVVVIGIMLSANATALEAIPKQEEPEIASRTMSFSINTIRLMLLQPSGKFAFALSERIALTIPFVMAYYVDNTPNTAAALTPRALGFCLGLGATFYLSDRAFSSGWYLEPDFVFTWERTRATGANYWAFTPEIRFGRGWVWSNGLTLSFGLGVGWNFGLSGLPSTPLALGGFIPTGELAVGYSW